MGKPTENLGEVINFEGELKILILRISNLQIIDCQNFEFKSWFHNFVNQSPGISKFFLKKPVKKTPLKRRDRYC